MVRCWRILAVGLFAVGLSAATTATAQTVSRQRALVGQYCVGCHNDKLKTAGLALNTLDIDNVGESPEVWERVARKLRSRVMPPPGRPRPDDNGYDELISHLETSLDRASAAKPNPGRPLAFRRLSRTEYQNVIRDLLALDVDVASMLPKDDASFGFDNVSVGGISPTLLERYLAAAQKISRLAIGSVVRSPSAAVVVLPVDLTQEGHLEGLPLGTRGGALVRHNFPRDGEYEIELRLTRDRNESIEGLYEPHQLEVSLDGAQVQLFTVTPQRRTEGPQQGQIVSFQDRADDNLSVRIPVKGGPHELGIGFVKRPSVLLETERQPYQARFNMDRHPRSQPALYSVSITGPFNPGAVDDTPSRKRLFTCRPARASGEEACAKTIISTLMRRAYRRPVSESNIQTALAFYRDGRADGGFEAGIELALRSILINPEFLYRVERDPAGIAPNTAYALTDLELASRISFFLWSSIPDDELLETAAAGKLHEPRILAQQVRRMLKDRRSQSLVTNFAEQWLYLRNLDSTVPDPRLFPDFDDNLRQAFRRETELLFESIATEDRSVVDLLTANYTFLNERLAKHYGIPNVYGSRFRRVTFDANSVRGGLLGHGSILTVTSYGNRTSPVLRGKWILENLLGSAPPPPPPDVPPLKENDDGSQPQSMRERMAQHRSNPACSGCHNLMDPVGLSTENFDAVGRWRSRSEDGSAVDASGALPDGTIFEGVAGLRQALIKRPELFVSTLTEKLLTYALGRGLEHYDSAAVRTIVRDAQKDNYHFSSIIAGIINSTPFRMRRSES
jgi:mono/diheme cytochrome c family protein